MMDRYLCVSKPSVVPPIVENEIWITSLGSTHSYIAHAKSLLQGKGSSEIVIKATGRAINKAVMIVKLIKMEIVGLHQITSIGSTEIPSKWETLEEGLLPLETMRHVSKIAIILSKKMLNPTSVGYQPPGSAHEVESTDFESEGEGSATATDRDHGDSRRGNSTTVIVTSEEDDDDDDGEPLRPIFCLKNKSAMKDFDDKEDCFILDFNPDDTSIDFSKLSLNKLDHDNDPNSPDISVIAEKGQVACRDYPHPRHLCVKYSFENSPHESYCELCYCYVCDVAAPCKMWSGHDGHCHACNKENWTKLRKYVKENPNATDHRLA